MSIQARDDLRKQLRAARDALGKNGLQHRSLSICNQLIPLLSAYKHIGSYLAFGAEVDLSSLLSVFTRNHQKCYMPVVLPEFMMTFAPVDDSTVFSINNYGIKEPHVEPSLYKPAVQLDCVLVPLVGFDIQCNRMGMGGGYYDRCFAHRKNTNILPALIGVAYEVQHAETVFAQSWDVPMDMVVTETQVIQR